MKAEYISAMLMVLGTAAAYWLGLLVGRKEGYREGYEEAYDEQFKQTEELIKKDKENGNSEM